MHANLQALQAVLADVERRGVDEVWNVGDLVGFGGSPREVLDLLRQKGVRSILGNLDEKTMELGPQTEDPRSPHYVKHRTFHWTYAQLRPEDREYLRSLPREARLEVLGRRILLVHGSPESIDEYIQPGTPEERLRELAGRYPADVIVAGHAHQPFVHKVGGTLFVNTGSVGRPEGAGGRACYALLTVKPEAIRARHVECPYDLPGALDAISRAGLPGEYARMIATGRKFDEVAAEAARRPARRSGRAPDFVLRRVRQLAGVYRCEARHARHVTRLALGLFDQLAGVHGLGGRERLLLESAGLLHDIGWARGRRGHHKESMRMILAASDLGLTKGEQAVVANVARYHRRALPAGRHANYRRLNEGDRATVRLLGGLLRLADGLDCRHRGVVRSVEARATPRRLNLAIHAAREAEAEKRAARGKADLLEQALGRKVLFRWHPAPAGCAVLNPVLTNGREGHGRT